MAEKCAWCQREAAVGERYHDLPDRAHGFCSECYLTIRITETFSRIRARSGPFHVFLPPGREDIAERIRREAPPGCSIIVHYDRRTGERRRTGGNASSNRRGQKERRVLDLSFVAPVPPRMADGAAAAPAGR